MPLLKIREIVESAVVDEPIANMKQKFAVTILLVEDDDLLSDGLTTSFRKLAIPSMLSKTDRMPLRF